MPPVPPEPTLSERFAGLSYQDVEEDTFIRPETMLRRALMAIGPQYAVRTDIDSDGDDEDEDDSPYVPTRPPFETRGRSTRRRTEDTERQERSPTKIDPNDETTRQRVATSWRRRSALFPATPRLERRRATGERAATDGRGPGASPPSA